MESVEIGNRWKMMQVGEDSQEIQRRLVKKTIIITDGKNLVIYL